MLNRLLKNKGAFLLFFHFVVGLAFLFFTFSVGEKLILRSYLSKKISEKISKIETSYEEGLLRQNNTLAYNLIRARYKEMEAEYVKDRKLELVRLRKNIVGGNVGAKVLANKKGVEGENKYLIFDMEGLKPVFEGSFPFKLGEKDLKRIRDKHKSRESDFIGSESKEYLTPKGEEKFILFSFCIESKNIMVLSIRSTNEMDKPFHKDLSNIVPNIKFGVAGNGHVVVAKPSGRIMNFTNTSEVLKNKDYLKDLGERFKNLDKVSSTFIEHEIKEIGGEGKVFQRSFIKKYSFPDIIVISTIYSPAERKEGINLLAFLSSSLSIFLLITILLLALLSGLIIFGANFFLQRLEWELQKFNLSVVNSLESLNNVDEQSLNILEFKNYIALLNNAVSEISATKSYRHLFRETINQSYSDIIIIVDEESNIIETLGQTKLVIGSSRESLIGQQLASAFKNSFKDSLVDEISNSSDGTMVGRVVKHFRPDGLKIFLQVDVKEIGEGERLFRAITMKDISQKLILEKSMDDTSMAYSLLFDNIGDMIFVNKMNINTLNTSVFTANKVAINKLGYKESEIIGKPFNDLIDISKIESESDLKRQLAMGETIAFKANLLKKDGSTLNGQVTAVPFETENFHAVMFFVKDFSYSQFLKRSLKESETQLKEIFSKIPSIAILVDISRGGKIIEANKKAEEFYGFESQEFLNLNISALVVSEQVSDDKMALSLNSGVHFANHKTKNNFVKRVEVSSTLIEVKGRNVMIMLVRDLTYSDQERRAFNLHSMILQNSLDTQKDMMFCLDKEYRYIHMNRAFEQYFGIKEKNSVGLKYSNHIHKEEEKENIAVLQEGGESDYESWVLNKSGERRLFRIVKKAILDESNNRVGINCWMSDITEIKDVYEELEKTKKELSPTNIFKGNLLANMSHEIRTPMNGIIGLSDMLMHTRMNKQQREYLSIINRSSSSLLKIINDILDLSKIESGKSIVREIEFSVDDLMQDTIDLFKPQILNKGIKVSYSVPKHLPNRLLGDYYKIRQILTNLVGNSIKFTEKGEVSIKISSSKNGSKDHLSLKFTVKDTGVGINKQDLDKLFKFFSQIDHPDMEYEGTGLGLIISKKLIEILGGKISVSSEKGRGSSFQFEIKLKKVPNLTLDLASVTLVGEKMNHYRYHSLTKMFKSFGVGQIKFMKLEALQGGGKLDEDGLIISYLKLPYIKEIGEQFANAKATKLSFFDKEIDKNDQKILEGFGFKGSLLGNVEIKDLHRIVGGAIGSKSHKFKVWSFLNLVPKRDEKILLLEDNEINSIITCDLIKKKGFEVEAYSRVEEAMKSVDFSKIDLVLADIQMPDINGMEATALIREKTKKLKRYIPVIAVTAYTLPGDKEKCLNAGMDDYVTKPIDKEELYAKIEKYLNLDEKNEGLVDVEELYDSFDNNIPLIKQVIKVILDNLPSQISKFEKSFKNNQIERVESLAHSMKGSLGSINPKKTIELLNNLESASRMKNQEKAVDAYKRLKENLLKLEQFLKNLDKKIG